MSSPASSHLTRRALLSATGVGVLATLAGCNPFGGAAETITVTAAPTEPPVAPQTPTVLLGLIFTTRLHAQNLSAAVTADKRDAALLSVLLRDRKAHLAALEAEYTRRYSTPAPVDTAAPATTTPASADPDEIIGRIRGDASTAQSQFTDALTDATRFQAQLYGSIAACVATHRMVLA